MKERLYSLDSHTIKWTHEEAFYGPIDIKRQRLRMLERIDSSYMGNMPVNGRNYCSTNYDPLKTMLKKGLIDMVRYPYHSFVSKKYTQMSYVRITEKGKKYYEMRDGSVG